MTWYAIRTAPGSQLPQREFKAVVTRSRKGYRIDRTVNPDLSMIERSLDHAGIRHWMPAEKRLQRDRRKTHVWRTRRFALMVGWVFVQDPDWYKLYDVPGVLGVVGHDGVPLPIDILDILKVRSAEARAEAAFDAESLKARQAVRKAARRDPSLQKLVERFDIAGTISIPLDEAKAA